MFTKVTSSGRLLAASLVLTSSALAAELHAETLKAWDAYVAAAKQRLQQGMHSDRPFPTIAAQSGWWERLKAGEILVVPTEGRTPKRIPMGLIHRWTAAIFVKGASLKESFRVARDYGRYKQYYGPTVRESKALSCGPLSGRPIQDRYSNVVVNRVALAKIALDIEYESNYVQVDEHTWYTISSSSRISEVQNYGSAAERRGPADEGSGYIWRVFSISKFEERDGGVLLEVESNALSREVPGSLRWIADPAIRRATRNEFTAYLQKTRVLMTANGTAVGAGGCGWERGSAREVKTAR